MGHRHLFFASQTSDVDHGIWSHPYADPQPQLGIVAANGSFMLHRDIAAVGGVNPMPYFDIPLRSNNLPSSNVTMEVPNHMAANPGPLQYPYLYVSNRIQPNYVQTGTPCYKRFANGHASISINPQMEYGRAPFKRNNHPAISMTVDRGNTNVYSSAGSSSNFPVPSSLQPSPTPCPQYWAWDPASMPLAPRNSDISTACVGSNRNVRSRQSHALNLETNQVATHYLHPSTNISGLVAAGQWIHAPVCLDSQRRVLPSGSGGFNHETFNMEIDVGYMHNLVHNASSSTPFPTFHGMSSQVMDVGHDNFGNRAARYNAISSYQSMEFASTLEDGSRLGMESSPLSGHSRPLSIIGRSNERNGRSRTFFDRLQPFSDGDIARGSWLSEGVPLVERSAIYDPRNFYDQHHDMRLDSDNMSYEELLALEESIGNVSTGLSENTISLCLMELVYCSSEKDPKERNCVICLEKYKCCENLGELKCGHDFHASCVKKWLLIKNVCPICKGAALPDDSLKEK